MNMHMHMGIIIKRLREQKGMSQEELGALIGVQKAAIQKYESGKVKNIKKDNIKILADYFDVTPSYLLGYREKEKKQNQIPLLGTIAAGLPMFAEQNIEEYLTCDMKMSGEFFALRVKGDSMNAARINPGDIVIIRIQPVVEKGEIAAVRVDGDNATLKRFYQDGQQITLMPQSLNPAHQIQTYDTEKTDIEIYGKAMKGIFIVK